jgi:hypothetical protein
MGSAAAVIAGSAVLLYQKQCHSSQAGVTIYTLHTQQCRHQLQHATLSYMILNAPWQMTRQRYASSSEETLNPKTHAQHSLLQKTK